MASTSLTQEKSLQNSTAALRGKGVDFTAVGLVLPDNLSQERWSEIIKTLPKVGDALQLAIGDALNFGESKYGSKYDLAIEAGLGTYGSLRILASVSKRFAIDRRRAGIPFSFYQEITCKSDEDQDAWLNYIEEKRPTRDQFRAILRGSSTVQELEAKELSTNNEDSENQDRQSEQQSDEPVDTQQASQAEIVVDGENVVVNERQNGDSLPDETTYSEAEVNTSENAEDATDEQAEDVNTSSEPASKTKHKIIWKKAIEEATIFLPNDRRVIFAVRDESNGYGISYRLVINGTSQNETHTDLASIHRSAQKWLEKHSNDIK